MQGAIRVRDDSAKLARREFLASMSAGLAGLALGPRTHRSGFARKGECRSGGRLGTWTSTYTYKTVGDLEIKADVYRPADDVRHPVLMWIHGGALIRARASTSIEKSKSGF